MINQSAHQFIQSVRIQRALEWLKKDGGTIGEITRLVGFDDPGYITRVFKNHYGYLPLEVTKVPQ